MTDEQLEQSWQKVVGIIKDGPVNLPLWEALEKCRALQLEGGKLYIGMDVTELHRASALAGTQAKGAIESACARVFGERPSLVVIEGVDDGALERERERARARADAETRDRERLERRQAELQRKSWESLAQTLQVEFTKVTEKSLPWNLVAYMEHVFGLIAEVEDISNAEGIPQKDTDRGLARSLDTVARQIDGPIVWVALEYKRFRST